MKAKIITLSAALCASSGMAQLVSYPMNEASWSGSPPQVTDTSGNGQDGTAVGGANTVLDPTFGQVGSFDGSGQYVSVGGPTGLVAGARTIVAWVDPVANNLNLGQPIATGGVTGAGDFFGIGGTGGENSGPAALPQYELYVDHWGTPAYHSTTEVTPGQWNFVAMTYDGNNTVTFYINGVFAGDWSGTLYDYDITSYTFGGTTIGGSTTEPSLDGLMHDVGIYGSDLTAAQIGDIYADTQPGTVPDGASPATLLLSALSLTLAGWRAKRRLE